MTLSQEQKRTLLSEHFLLRHMSEADLDALAEHTLIKSFDADEIIFKRDDVANEMMVIIEGRVQISSPAKTADKDAKATEGVVRPSAKRRAGKVVGFIDPSKFEDDLPSTQATCG